jgi:3-dehydroquinate synthase class II
LNERQKNKIVEALSNADSINDAKVIFETLESAVGSVTGKAQPQSLRETIERPTATLPRREAKDRRSPVTDRMQILAGIKKLK